MGKDVFFFKKGNKNRRGARRQFEFQIYEFKIKR